MNNSILTRRDNLYERMVKFIEVLNETWDDSMFDEITDILQKNAEIEILIKGGDYERY